MAQATLAKCQNAGSSLSRNCVECLTQKVLVSARFYFYLLSNAHYFVSTSMRGNLFSFFFASVLIVQVLLSLLAAVNSL